VHYAEEVVFEQPEPPPTQVMDWDMFEEDLDMGETPEPMVSEIEIETIDDDGLACHTARGTLMGTRLSFIVLSLLHMYAAEQACTQYGRSGYSKAYNIHGDDMICAWPEALFARYEDNLVALGFRINVDKGTVSDKGGTFCGVYYRVLRSLVPSVQFDGRPWASSRELHLERMLHAGVISQRELKKYRIAKKSKKVLGFVERRFVRPINRPYLSSLLRLTKRKGSHNSETSSLPSVLNANLKDCNSKTMRLAVMRVANRAHPDIFALYRKCRVPLTDPVEVLGAGVRLVGKTISRRGRQIATKTRYWPVDARSEFYRYVRTMHNTVRFPLPVREKLFDLNRHVESFARRSKQRGAPMKRTLKTLRANVLSQAFLDPSLSKGDSSSLLSNNTAVLRWRNMRWLGKMLNSIYYLVGSGNFSQNTKFSNMNIKEVRKIKRTKTLFSNLLIKSADIRILIQHESAPKLSKTTQNYLIKEYFNEPTLVSVGPPVVVLDTDDSGFEIEPHYWPKITKPHR
jgi:hypothetical protein